MRNVVMCRIWCKCLKIAGNIDVNIEFDMI